MDQNATEHRMTWINRVKGPLFLLAGLALGVVLGLFIYYGGPGAVLDRSEGQSVPPAIGSPVEDFRLETIDGKEVVLSELSGRPVLINFWATWCPPCRDEMPLLEQTAQRYSDQLVVVGVDYAEDRQTVDRFVQEMKIQFPIVLDEDGAVADRYFVRSFPVSFFVDADGILRAQHVGGLNEILVDTYLGTIGLKQ